MSEISSMGKLPRQRLCIIPLLPLRHFQSSYEILHLHACGPLVNGYAQPCGQPLHAPAVLTDLRCGLSEIQVEAGPGGRVHGLAAEAVAGRDESDDAKVDGPDGLVGWGSWQLDGIEAGPY